MSGIYIPNMQMPTDDYDDKMEPTAVWVYPNGYTVVFKDNGNVMQYTKAIPVPDHGDLIDRDMVLKKAWDVETFVDAVKYAPIIIPASGGAE